LAESLGKTVENGSRNHFVGLDHRAKAAVLMRSLRASRRLGKGAVAFHSSLTFVRARFGRHTRLLKRSLLRLSTMPTVLIDEVEAISALAGGIKCFAERIWLGISHLIREGEIDRKGVQN
jgi:hypothetical protein